MNYYTPTIDFDEQITLSLCDSRRKKIMEIYAIDKLKRKVPFVSSDEISFDVALYRMDSEEKKVRNELFDAVKEDLQICMNDKQYFVIKSCNVQSRKGEDPIKQVECYSYEYTLGHKIIENYDVVSRFLWDVHGSKDKDGYHMGFLNYVEEKTGWKVDYVSPKVLNKQRELKYTNRSVLDCIYDSAETFNCVFQFDTVNRGISAYDISEIGGNQGIVISDKNFIESIAQKINTQDLKTRLYLYGENNINFKRYNPVGKAYLDNISFYRQFGYLSVELCEALDKHKEAIEKIDGEYKHYLDNVKKLEGTLGEIKDKKDNIEIAYRVVTQEIDAAISSQRLGQHTIELQKHLDKSEELKNKIIECTKMEKETLNLIAGQQKKLDELKATLTEDKFFTPELMREYNEFIKEEVQGDNSFTYDMEDQLYAYCKEILDKISYPTISFDVDLESFRKISNFKQPMSRMKVGDMVYLECEELNIKAEVRVLSFDLDYTDHSVSVSFGNKFKSNSSEMYLTELLDDLKSTSTSVSLSEFYWNRGIEQYSRISKHLDSNLDLAKRAIVTADGQKPILDDRGLWLYKQNKDGSIDNNQIRAVHNVIALTTDNWKTVTTAITGEGINAQAITGRLGNFVTINANQILVNEGGEDSPLEKIMKKLDEETKKEMSSEIKTSEQNTKTKINDVANQADEKIKSATAETDSKIKNVQNDTDKKIKTTSDEINGKIDTSVSGLDTKITETNERLDSEVAKMEQFAKDYVRKYGGKTYRQPTKPNEKEISDGALWLQTTDSGKLIKVYRYSETYNRWQELSDIILKDQSYGGTRIGDKGITVPNNGVTINRDGITVANGYQGITVSTEMNANGFYIKRQRYSNPVENIFSVAKDGTLSIKSGNDEIKVTSKGISMPPTAKLEIGENTNYNNKYICINEHGVQFGREGYGFEFKTNSGDLTIGGELGLKYSKGELFIGGKKVASQDKVESMWESLMRLGDTLAERQAVPAYVQFG